jgi:hypothetical protein
MGRGYPSNLEQPGLLFNSSGRSDTALGIDAFSAAPNLKLFEFAREHFHGLPMCILVVKAIDAH